jgi:hypothetical protein
MGGISTQQLLWRGTKEQACQKVLYVKKLYRRRLELTLFSLRAMASIKQAGCYAFSTLATNVAEN